MKILHVIGSMDPRMGGVSQAVRTIVKSLTDLNIDNEIVTMDLPDSSFLLQEKMQLIVLGTGRSSWGYSNKLIPWLVSNLSRFDAVIVHGMWQFFTYAVHKANKSVIETEQRNPQIYVMPHGMLDPYFQRAKGRKLKAVRNWLFWKLVEGKVINDADGILFTCEDELRLAREPFHPYKPKAETVVGLGIEPPPAFTSEMTDDFLDFCPQVRNKKFLLFLSRIHVKKGVDLLIDAYANVYANQAADNIPQLVIAGPGLDTPYGNKMKELAASKGSLSASIIFPGMLMGNAKWGAFYNCEAFVLPSHQENFGIAIVEAMACSKPVIISNQVNIWREVMADNAGLVTSNNVSDLTEKLSGLSRMSAYEITEMGNRAQETFKRFFTTGAFTNNFLRLVKAEFA